MIVRLPISGTHASMIAVYSSISQKYSRDEDLSSINSYRTSC